jgi:UDP-galactopyranose mutase
MIINRRLFPFPITKEAINNFKEKYQILQELENRPNCIDRKNFETASISIFGKTLYNYFIKNYTEKMWGIAADQLTSEWVSKRLELREKEDNGLFKAQWQGLPVKGYSYLLEKMIEGIPIVFNTDKFNVANYDVIVSSAPIDKLLDYKYGKLPYRSLRFHYEADEYWENENYGTINLPQDPKFVRKCNFKILHKQNSEHNWIQYQEPIAADDNNIPMYPINTRKNNEIFDKYLKEICENKNICPIGRLGLYKYLDMDKAIAVAHDMHLIIENYLDLSSTERHRKIKEIRARY